MSLANKNSTKNTHSKGIGLWIVEMIHKGLDNNRSGSCIVSDLLVRS